MIWLHQTEPYLLSQLILKTWTIVKMLIFDQYLFCIYGCTIWTGNSSVYYFMDRCFISCTCAVFGFLFPFVLGTLVFYLCYNFVTALLQLCYNFVTVCCNFVTNLLQFCCNFVTTLLQFVVNLLHVCYSLSQACYIFVPTLQQRLWYELLQLRYNFAPCILKISPVNECRSVVNTTMHVCARWNVLEKLRPHFYRYFCKTNCVKMPRKRKVCPRSFLYLAIYLLHEYYCGTVLLKKHAVYCVHYEMTMGCIYYCIMWIFRLKMNRARKVRKNRKLLNSARKK